MVQPTFEQFHEYLRREQEEERERKRQRARQGIVEGTARNAGLPEGFVPISLEEYSFLQKIPMELRSLSLTASELGLPRGSEFLNPKTNKYEGVKPDERVTADIHHPVPYGPFRAGEKVIDQFGDIVTATDKGVLPESNNPNSYRVRKAREEHFRQVLNEKLTEHLGEKVELTDEELASFMVASGWAPLEPGEGEEAPFRTTYAYPSDERRLRDALAQRRKNEERNSTAGMVDWVTAGLISKDDFHRMTSSPLGALGVVKEKALDSPFVYSNPAALAGQELIGSLSEAISSGDPTKLAEAPVSIYSKFPITNFGAKLIESGSPEGWDEMTLARLGLSLTSESPELKVLGKTFQVLTAGDRIIGLAAYGALNKAGASGYFEEDIPDQEGSQINRTKVELLGAAIGLLIPYYGAPSTLAKVAKAPIVGARMAFFPRQVAPFVASHTSTIADFVQPNVTRQAVTRGRIEKWLGFEDVPEQVSGYTFNKKRAQTFLTETMPKLLSDPNLSKQAKANVRALGKELTTYQNALHRRLVTGRLPTQDSLYYVNNVIRAYDDLSAKLVEDNKLLTMLERHNELGKAARGEELGEELSSSMEELSARYEEIAGEVLPQYGLTPGSFALDAEALGLTKKLFVPKGRYRSFSNLFKSGVPESVTTLANKEMKKYSELYKSKLAELELIKEQIKEIDTVIATQSMGTERVHIERLVSEAHQLMEEAQAIRGRAPAGIKFLDTYDELNRQVEELRVQLAEDASKIPGIEDLLDRYNIEADDEAIEKLLTRTQLELDNLARERRRMDTEITKFVHTHGTPIERRLQQDWSAYVDARDAVTKTAKRLSSLEQVDEEELKSLVALHKELSAGAKADVNLSKQADKTLKQIRSMEAKLAIYRKAQKAHEVALKSEETTLKELEYAEAVASGEITLDTARASSKLYLSENQAGLLRRMRESYRLSGEYERHLNEEVARAKTLRKQYARVARGPGRPAGPPLGKEGPLTKEEVDRFLNLKVVPDTSNNVVNTTPGNLDNLSYALGRGLEAGGDAGGSRQRAAYYKHLPLLFDEARKQLASGQQGRTLNEFVRFILKKVDEGAPATVIAGQIPGGTQYDPHWRTIAIKVKARIKRGLSGFTTDSVAYDEITGEALPNIKRRVKALTAEEKKLLKPWLDLRDEYRKLSSALYNPKVISRYEKYASYYGKTSPKADRMVALKNEKLQGVIQELRTIFDKYEGLKDKPVVEVDPKAAKSLNLLQEMMDSESDRTKSILALLEAKTAEGRARVRAGEENIAEAVARPGRKTKVVKSSTTKTALKKLAKDVTAEDRRIISDMEKELYEIGYKTPDQRFDVLSNPDKLKSAFWEIRRKYISFFTPQVLDEAGKALRAAQLKKTGAQKRLTRVAKEIEELDPSNTFNLFNKTVKSKFSDLNLQGTVTSTLAGMVKGGQVRRGDRVVIILRDLVAPKEGSKRVTHGLFALSGGHGVAYVNLPIEHLDSFFSNVQKHVLTEELAEKVNWREMARGELKAHLIPGEYSAKQISQLKESIASLTDYIATAPRTSWTSKHTMYDPKGGPEKLVRGPYRKTEDILQEIKQLSEEKGWGLSHIDRLAINYTQDSTNRSLLHETLVQQLSELEGELQTMESLYNANVAMTERVLRANIGPALAAGREEVENTRNQLKFVQSSLIAMSNPEMAQNSFIRADGTTVPIFGKEFDKLAKKLKAGTIQLRPEFAGLLGPGEKGIRQYHKLLSLTARRQIDLLNGLFDVKTKTPNILSSRGNIISPESIETFFGGLSLLTEDYIKSVGMAKALSNPKVQSIVNEFILDADQQRDFMAMLANTHSANLDSAIDGKYASWAHHVPFLKRFVAGNILKAFGTNFYMAWENSIEGAEFAVQNTAMRYGKTLEKIAETSTDDVGSSLPGTPQDRVRRMFARAFREKEFRAYMNELAPGVELSPDYIHTVSQNPLIYMLHPEYWSNAKLPAGVKDVARAVNKSYTQLKAAMQVYGMVPNQSLLFSHILVPGMRGPTGAKGDPNIFRYLLNVERHIDDMSEFGKMVAAQLHTRPDNIREDFFQLRGILKTGETRLPLASVLRSATDQLGGVFGSMHRQIISRHYLNKIYDRYVTDKDTYRRLSDIFEFGSDGTFNFKEGGADAFTDKAIREDMVNLVNLIGGKGSHGVLGTTGGKLEDVARAIAMGRLIADASVVGVQFPFHISLQLLGGNVEGALGFFRHVKNTWSDEGWISWLTTHQDELQDYIHRGMRVGTNSLIGGEFHSTWFLEHVPLVGGFGRAVTRMNDIQFQRWLMYMKVEAVRHHMHAWKTANASQTMRTLMQDLDGFKPMDGFLGKPFVDATNEEALQAVVRLVNNQFGGLPGYQFGTGATRRFFERLILIVPGFFRARAGLLAQSIGRPGSLEGVLAGSIMARELAFAATIGYVGSMLMGEEDKFIDNLKKGPQSGSRWLSVEGDNFSISTIPNASALALFSKFVDDTKDYSKNIGTFVVSGGEEGSLDPFESYQSFQMALEGRLSPIASSTYNAFKRKDFRGRRYKNVKDFIIDNATIMAPIFLEQTIEGIREEGRLNPTRTLAEFVGRNYRRKSTIEEINDYVKMYFPNEYAQGARWENKSLTGQMKDTIRMASPEVTALESDWHEQLAQRQSDVQLKRGELFDLMENFDESFYETPQAIDGIFSSQEDDDHAVALGQMTREMWRERYEERQNVKSSELDSLNEVSVELFGGKTFAEQLAEYENEHGDVPKGIYLLRMQLNRLDPEEFRKDHLVTLKDGTQTLVGVLDYDAYDAAKEELIKSFPAPVQDRYRRTENVFKSQVEQEYERAKRALDIFMGMPKYKTATVEDSDRIDEFRNILGQAMTTISSQGIELDTETRQVMRVGIIKQLTEAGLIRSELDINLAIKAVELESSTEAEEEFLNVERMNYALNSPSMVAFFPWTVGRVPGIFKSLLPRGVAPEVDYTPLANPEASGLYDMPATPEEAIAWR